MSRKPCETDLNEDTAVLIVRRWNRADIGRTTMVTISENTSDNGRGSSVAAIPARAMREVHRIGDQTVEWTTGHPALAARGITMIGISHAKAGFEFETNGWAFGQLLLCYAGEGRARVRG